MEKDLIQTELFTFEEVNISNWTGLRLIHAKLEKDLIQTELFTFEEVHLKLTGGEGKEEKWVMQ